MRNISETDYAATQNVLETATKSDDDVNVHTRDDKAKFARQNNSHFILSS